MTLKDVVKVLIEYEVLLCDYVINVPDVTGNVLELDKNTIKHNNILKNLMCLDTYDKLVEGPKQNETKEEFHKRAFSEE